MLSRCGQSPVFWTALATLWTLLTSQVQSTQPSVEPKQRNLLKSSLTANLPACNGQWSPQAAANYAEFSGAVLNELGFYDSCMSYPNDSKYILLVLEDPQTHKASLFWGICVSLNCTESNINAYYQPVLKAMGVNLLVDARDPHDPKNRHAFGPGSVAFIIFSVVMSVFVGIATFISQRRKHTEKLRKQSEITRSTIKHINQNPIDNAAASVTGSSPSVAMAPPAGGPAGQAVQTKAKQKETPFFALFDATTNVGTIIYPRIVNPSVQVFDLLRVMAMVWVVVGHELAYRLTVSENFVDQGFLDYTSNSWYFTYNMSAFYAVDLFLFMGGYVSIVSLSKFINNFSPFTPLKLPVIYLFTVFKRYMRIMPAYAYLLWFYYTLGPTLIQGPISQGMLYNWPCKFTNFWESFILGWKSDVNTNTMCTGWCWYLAVDFQVFCTIPLILIISTYFGKLKKQAGIGIVASLAVLSISLTIYEGYDHHVQYINVYDTKQTMNTYYYAKGAQRAVMYYIGCLFAYFTMKDDKKKNPKPEPVEDPAQSEEEKREKLLQEERRKKRKIAAIKKMQMIYFSIAFCLLLGITLILHYFFQWGRKVNNIDRTWNVLFITFGKIIFVLSFMTVLLIISFRFKGFSKYLAENRLVQLIANLGFTMYLFHFPMIIIRTYSQKSIPTYGGQDLFSSALADLSYTLAAGLFVAVIIEMPAMNLWRVYCEGYLLSAIKKMFERNRHHHAAPAHGSTVDHLPAAEKTGLPQKPTPSRDPLAETPDPLASPQK